MFTVSPAVAELAHGYARERLLHVDHEKTNFHRVLLDLAGLLRHFIVSGSRVGDGHDFADGTSALSVGIACARADAVGTVERDGCFAVCACVRVDLPPRAAVSQSMEVSAASPQLLIVTVKILNPV